jgi:Domain of unknown function (DUF4124)
LLLALPSLAEQKYYTWVDAQGNVHNTLIQSKPEETKSPQKEFDSEDYLSEEKFQKNLKDKPKGEKPFYTWTDAQGIIRSEAKPDVVVEFSATEVVYDAVFAPPFRVPDYVMQGLCCENYKQAFITKIGKDGSASYKVNGTGFLFKTNNAEVAASYFSVDDFGKHEILLIKAFEIKENTSFEIIALSDQYKPLYLESSVEGVFVKQTWKDLAYKKVMLEVADPEIKYLIIFVNDDQQEALINYSLAVIRDSSSFNNEGEAVGGNDSESDGSREGKGE